MRDFNFFAPYEQEPKKKASGSNVLMIVAAGLLALCLALVIFNTMTLMSLEKSITNLDSKMNESDFKAKVANVQVKQAELTSLKADQVFFEEMDIVMDKQNKVNEAAVRLIAEQVPDNLHLTDLSIVEDKIDIKGKSYNKVAVAQFQHNLRQTEEFDNLFVSEMVKEEAYYNFSIMLEAKGDETDEN